MLNSNTVDFSYIMKNYASVPDSSVKISKAILKHITMHIKTTIRSALRDIEICYI